VSDRALNGIALAIVGLGFTAFFFIWSAVTAPDIQEASDCRSATVVARDAYREVPSIADSRYADAIRVAEAADVQALELCGTPDAFRAANDAVFRADAYERDDVGRVCRDADRESDTARCKSIDQ
jgi:hypothetical protein